jgi:hypothetical protein
MLALAAASILALVMATSPALASPLVHFAMNATEAGDGGGPLAIPCRSQSYRFTAGEFRFIFRDPSVAAHITIVGGRAIGELDGLPYRVVGSETYNDAAGRLTAKIAFVRFGGGIADSVNIVLRDDPNGGFAFDFGSCGF